MEMSQLTKTIWTIAFPNEPKYITKNRAGSSAVRSSSLGYGTIFKKDNKINPRNRIDTIPTRFSNFCATVYGIFERAIR